MLDFLLIVARLLHYAAVTTLAGVAFFPLYAYGHAEPKEISRRRQVVLLSAAVGALLSGLLWFSFSAANMSGGAWADVADPEVLWTVLDETTFGWVWMARMLLAVLIVGLTVVRPLWIGFAGRDLVTAVLGAVLLASVAGTGHSQIEEGATNAVHVASDAAHLLAAGAWLGGLVPLGFILFDYSTGRDTSIIDVERILLRFSSMGYAAAATLIVSGLVNSWFLVGAVSNLLTTPYGQILLGKLALFVAMLALAAGNRFWLVPRMSATRENSSRPAVWLGRLRYHVLGEQFLGVMVLLAVSVLGTMQPAVGQ